MVLSYLYHLLAPYQPVWWNDWWKMIHSVWEVFILILLKKSFTSINYFKPGNNFMKKTCYWLLAFEKNNNKRSHLPPKRKQRENVILWNFDQFTSWRMKLWIEWISAYCISSVVPSCVWSQMEQLYKTNIKRANCALMITLN